MKKIWVHTQKKLYLDKKDNYLKGIDHIFKAKDGYPIRYALRFHINPGLSVVKTMSGNSALIQISKNKSLIFTVSDENLDIEKSIFLGEKKIIDSNCITISGNLVNKNKILNWEIRKKYLIMNLKVKNALISVSNKENLISLLKILKKYNINIISSGGTYASIKKMGYECVELSKYTGFKEMLDGRVKTLHPKIHAGILHDRQNKKHKSEMSKQNFPAIDLIVVNFYPFQKIVTNTKNPKQIIENIDIGGPTMVRAAKTLKTLQL